ncbi:putative nuclease HARBI1 [Nylanderia fulva]|uniref:putative nuclease HARBI1 n=1 Tax=Nylanderia fulva TaxID=613905 RepID=UPI0010FB0EFA|nr:putative nuclease HARBI1 [Nylanderia fulva]
MDAVRYNNRISSATIISSLIFLNNESDSSESSDSEEDEISLSDMKTLYLILMIDKSRGEMIATEKITEYVDRVIPNYSNTVFKEHFRMFPATFEMVLSLIGPALNATSTVTGRKPISAEKQLYIALWFMATPDSYRSVCTKFGVGKATAFRAVKRVVYALHCIAPRFIQWPNEDVAANIMEQFESICGFPKVISAIDGTHIKIRAPSIDAVSYINRKGFASLNVQVVCDSRGLFTHCYAGEVGSVHDARVFRNSPVARFLETPDLYFPNGSYIIGDAAYPIHPHLLVPFRDNGHLLNRQKNFNYCLSATRMVVERAIGQLKLRFRILLDCLPLTNVKKIPQFIIACCVLHNICILQNDVITVGIQHYDQDELQQPVRNNNTELGNATRMRVMNELQMKLQLIEE